MSRYSLPIIDEALIPVAERSPRAAAADPLSGERMLPELLQAEPALRPVFDRYGLRGCGGPYGPAESVAYFARAHGVELTELLSELQTARTGGAPLTAHAPHAAEANTDVADTIYRRFFKAGIATILTAGGVWGALLLIRIAMAHNFTAVSIHDINAHGHAQIFGWVGLFIMGFAYQAFPRMRHSSLWRPKLAVLSFCLMVGGILARAIGEPLYEYAALRGLALAGGVAEMTAIGLFVAIILQTFRQSGKPWALHEGYIVAGLAFFFVQAAYELIYLYANTAAITHDALLTLVANWQAPLRDLQIHGFALLVILGVGLRMFPALFEFRPANRRLTILALPLLVTGVLAEAGFFIAMRQTGNHVWAVPMYLAMLLLAGLSSALTFRWGLLARGCEPDRSVKFVRAGIVWLQAAMLMLVLAPLYMEGILPHIGGLSESGRHAVQIHFSHAYYGAVRHAITVGFISLIILGMAAKIVPTLNGVDIRRLRPLWLPFVLVNLGCFLRVTLQIGTDLRDWVYPLAGASGVLEVTGIALWGVHLWRIMNGWRPLEEYASASAADRCISASDKVAAVIDQYPQLLPVLVAQGFTPLQNPLLRRTLARTVNIRQAAALQKIELGALLSELNATIRNTGSPPRTPGYAEELRKTDR